MVLRCSLLGHDYGDTEVEREREERGNEVVIAVREYQTCPRCGTQKVISENTEVRSRSEPGQADVADDATAPPAVSAPVEEGPDPATDSSSINAGGHPSGPAPGDESAAGDVTEPGESAFDFVEPPVTDDGEILEDDPSTDREPGEWPDAPDVGPPVDTGHSPASWPDDEPAASSSTTDDAGSPSSSADEGESDDAIILEHTEPAATQADQSTAIETDLEESTDEDSLGTGIERTESPEPTRLDGPTEFYCPRCSFVTTDAVGSLRSGDICPDCRNGYLGERPRE